MAAIAAWGNKNSLALNRCEPAPFRAAPGSQPVYYFPKMVNLTNYHSKPSRFVHHRYPRPAALVTGTSTNTMASPQALLPMWLSAVILLAALHHAAPSVFVARRTLSRSSAGCKPGSPARSPSRPLLPTQADAEANGRPPARPVDAARGHLGQHDRTVLFQGQ